MAGDTTGDADQGDPLPDNVLFDLYRSYIGEPDAEADVYLGFGLFFGGILLAGIALLLFLWSGFYTPRTDPYFARAMPAYALGMLSLPAVMVGIVVLLPVEKRALYAALSGAGVTLLAVGGFVWAYPANWNSSTGADYTIPIVAVYAVGLAGVIASTGAALIAHQLERARPPTFEEVEQHRTEEPGETEGETWTDEEIQRDIEQAMAETDISWGGVEKTETRRLELNMGEMDVDTTGINVDPEETRSDGVDAQVQGLRSLKGGDKKTTTAENSTVDDQTAALNELKKKKREGETPDPKQDEDGLVDRFRGMFG